MSVNALERIHEQYFGDSSVMLIAGSPYMLTLLWCDVVLHALKGFLSQWERKLYVEVSIHLICIIRFINSNSINFVFVKFFHLLYFIFTYIHNLLDPVSYAFKREINLEKIEAGIIIVNNAWKGIKQYACWNYLQNTCVQWLRCILAEPSLCFK